MKKHEFERWVRLDVLFIVYYVIFLIISLGLILFFADFLPLMSIFFVFISIWFFAGVVVTVREYKKKVVDQEKLIAFLDINGYARVDGYPAYDSFGELRCVHFLPQGFFLDVKQDAVVNEELVGITTFDIIWLGFEEKGKVYRYLVIENGKQFCLYGNTLES